MADKGHRFCGYDRANTGTSDKVPGPLDAKMTLADLRGLLQAAEIEPPYVLVGASFGGLFAYMYAVMYPKEVAGMVLLDASFPKDERWDHTDGRSSRSRSTSSPPTSRPTPCSATSRTSR